MFLFYPRIYLSLERSLGEWRGEKELREALQGMLDAPVGRDPLDTDDVWNRARAALRREGEK